MGQYERRLLRELQSNPHLAIDDQRFWRTEVFSEFLDHTARMLSLEDPHDALVLARIGPPWAGRLAACSKDEANGHKARALGLLGSCQRAVGNLGRSEECYSAALDLGPSAIIRTDLLRRLAYLRIYQGNKSEALDIAQRSMELARAVSDLTDGGVIAGCYLARGHVYYASGQAGKAFADFSAAVQLVDWRRDPLYYYTALHNLVAASDEGVTPENIRLTLYRLGRALRSLGGVKDRSLAKYKIRWAQARFQWRLGAAGQAEGLLRTARKGLFKLGVAPLDVALISLDLAAVMIDNRRLVASQELAYDTGRMLKVLGVSAEALEAIAIWAKAERLTVELLQQIRQDLAVRSRPVVRDTEGSESPVEQLFPVH